MYRVYRFSQKKFRLDNLERALEDVNRRGEKPLSIVVSKGNLAEARDRLKHELPFLAGQVKTTGGCFSNEIWIEVSRVSQPEEIVRNGQ